MHSGSTHENKRPSVIPSSDIPISAAPEDADLEVRPFLAHKILSSVIAPTAVNLAWTHARHGQQVAFRSHPTPGLLIVLKGRAELVGGLRRLVQQGDVITLPRLHEYGFTGVGPEGLTALHVAFTEAPSASVDESRTLEQLIARNEVRSQLALQNPFFTLLRERKLETERQRSKLRECLRVFADAFQVFLFTRQSMCRDDHYVSTFNEHLTEELGHNTLLSVPTDAPAFKDPILRAVSSWFCHQMLVLDNVDKAVVNLVLETAGYHLGTLAGPIFAGDETEEYFDTHAEGDAEHKELAVRLLEGHHPDTYRRLHSVVEDSWDMLETMTRRIAHLVNLERTSS